MLLADIWQDKVIRNAFFIDWNRDWIHVRHSRGARPTVIRLSQIILLEFDSELKFFLILKFKSHDDNPTILTERENMALGRSLNRYSPNATPK